MAFAPLTDIVHELSIFIFNSFAINRGARLMEALVSQRTLAHAGPGNLFFVFVFMGDTSRE